MGSAVSTSTSTAITRAKHSSHVLRWTVEDFDRQYLMMSASEKKHVGGVQSPSFEVIHPDGISVTKWSVGIKITENCSKIGAFLYLLSCPNEHLGDDGGLRCNFGIAFGTWTNAKYHRYELTHKFTGCGLGYGWGEFITVAQLRGNWLLVSGAVRVQVDLTIFGTPESSTNTGTVDRIPKPKTPLHSRMDFDSLFTSHFLSDITVHCGSEIFPAHKAILAGRSDVFRAMLASDMEEVKSGVIHVPDMTAKGFEIILRYLYTGKLKEKDLDPDALLDVIYGAEKYGLEELKNYCFRKLVACINEENAGAMAVAAHSYNAEASVKATLQRFIQPSFFQLVKNGEFRSMVVKCSEAFF